METIRKPWVIAPIIILLFFVLLGWYFSHEPAQPITDKSSEKAQPVVGVATTSALIGATETLLNKRGGYLSNDVTPPSVFLDNVPNWEFGVLQQVRDLAKSMRNDYSRSQTQSKLRNPNLMSTVTHGCFHRLKANIKKG